MNTHDALTVKTVIAEDAAEMAIESMFRLYTHPITAAVREYTMNACDEHAEAGIDRPVEVTVRKRDNDILFTVQDHGRGMGHKTLVEVYTQIRLSSKRDNENTVGGFGIGAKSGLAASEQGFDVITSTGEEAHVLRCRHSDGGGIVNHIDPIDPEGLDTGTTVSVSFAPGNRATENHDQDVLLMIAAIAAVNDVRLTLVGIPTPLYLSPYLVNEPEDGHRETATSVIYPHGVIKGSVPIVFPRRALPTITLARYFRRHGLVLVADRPAETGRQYSGKGFAYLAGTPYPENFTFRTPSGRLSSLGKVGVVDFPLDGVSIPRHRESLTGISTETLDSLCGERIGLVVNEIVEKIRQPFLDRLSDLPRGVDIPQLIGELVVLTEFPEEEGFSGDWSGAPGTLLRIVHQALLRSLRAHRLDTEIPGVLMFTSRRAETKCHTYIYAGNKTDVGDAIVNYRQTTHGPNPFAVICVPDLPENVDLQSPTLLNRIRKNLKKHFDRTFETDRGVVLVRSVPTSLWIEESLRSSLDDVRNSAPFPLSSYSPESLPTFHGTLTWDELTHKEPRKTASGNRNYRRYNIESPGSLVENVDLTLSDVRERMDDDATLFIVRSQDLSDYIPGTTGFPLRIIDAALGETGRNATTPYRIEESHAAFLAWLGVSEVYVYDDTSSSSAARKDITRLLIERMREMESLVPDYQQYQADVRTAEVMKFANTYTAFQIVRVLGDSYSTLDYIKDKALRSLYSIGVPANVMFALERTISITAPTALGTLMDNYRLAEGAARLASIDDEIADTVLGSVLGTHGLGAHLETLARPGKLFTPRPPSLSSSAESMGGLDALMELIDGLNAPDAHGYRSTIDFDSQMYELIQLHLNNQVQLFHDEADELTRVLSEGRTSFSELIQASQEEMSAWESR